MIGEKDYIKGKYCLKNLWSDLNKKEVYKERYREIDYVRNKGFEIFDEIVILEREINRKEAAYKTKNFLEEDFTIGNGVIEWKDLSARIDVIVPTEEGLKIYFIESSTKTSDKSLSKGEFVNYICKKAKIKVSDIIVMHINKRYVREETLDLEKLFKKVSIKEEINSNIENLILNIRETLKNQEDYGKCTLESKCLLGKGCENAKKCFKDLDKWTIFNIDGNSMNLDKKIENFKKGIETYKDVKKYINPEGNFKIMLDAELTREPFIRRDKIKDFVAEIKNYPLYFLDFETFQEPIPSYRGRRPYMQIPFQYSLHILDGDSLTHKEFLGQWDSDTTIYFVENLIKDIKDDGGHIIAYNTSFEKGIIKSMAELHKEYRKPLMELYDRFIDIMTPFKNKDYYTRDMKFSYSIKKVFPALCKEKISYDKLDINNGELAMISFKSLKDKEDGEALKIRKDLLEYCKLDTLAMVKILEKLKEI